MIPHCDNPALCCGVEGVHDIYCCGSHVRISSNGVEVLSKPAVKHCPLHGAMYGCGKINVQTVQESIEKKIARFGFCCRERQFNADPTVAYGASEMMSAWLDMGVIDSAVVVCEGAGTVIVGNSKLVQGIGARLTGVIRTTPIREVIEVLESQGGIVLDKAAAAIDQVEGVRKAFSLGFNHPAVSVAGFQAECISELRSLEKAERRDVIIFSVCNTCTNIGDVKHISEADLVCASASRILRKEIGVRALLQVGVTIPVYALTQRGKELVMSYLSHFGEKLVVFRTKKLPYDVDKKGPVLGPGASSDSKSCSCAVSDANDHNRQSKKTHYKRKKL